MMQLTKKVSVTVVKDTKTQQDKQTNTRFIWSYDGKPCNVAPTSKPEKTKVY